MINRDQLIINMFVIRVCDVDSIFKMFVFKIGF